MKPDKYIVVRNVGAKHSSIATRNDFQDGYSYTIYLDCSEHINPHHVCELLNKAEETK